MYVEGKGLNKKLIKSFCFQLGKMFQVIPKLGVGGKGKTSEVLITMSYGNQI